jgi:uncharacterized protein YceK
MQGRFIMKKLFMVLILIASISGCASYQASSGYPRGYYHPSPAYVYGYHEAYRYTPHRRYHRW